MTMSQEPPDLVEVGLEVPSMGGRLGLRVACVPDERPRAARDLASVARRVGRWAARLTRFNQASELCALNHDPEAARVRVGPTMAAVLGWAKDAGRRTAGAVDVGLLDARLAAERGGRHRQPADHPRWEVRHARTDRHAVVLRQGRVRFDLDGVAKGWIADRALALLSRYPAAIVDAEGDIAISVGGPTAWAIGVADPTDPGTDLVTIAPERVGPRRFGVATSGIDIHRWGRHPDRHHLIDPQTGRPALTDLRQCTVVAGGAALAEAVAKAVVIRGSESGPWLLGRSDVLGAVSVGRAGEVLVTKGMVSWLV